MAGVEGSALKNESAPSLLSSPRGRKVIHFVGIGGVGMSGIAQVLLNLGYRVSGSDLKSTEITRRLRRSGARIHEGHRPSHAAGAQVVVVSSAVDRRNPEVLAARRRGIPVVPRARMLAELARLKRTVTVSGSHGKTTTTSMAAMALASAGADPTMIIGGQLKNIGSNARLGLGPYLVAEADESDGSFLLLSPLVAVATNVDNDHLDYHGSLARLKDAFVRHLNSVPRNGAAVICTDDPALRGLRRRLTAPLITYALKGPADWTAKGIRLGPDGSSFKALRRGAQPMPVRLRVPGRHNVQNALAALAAGAFLGFPAGRLVRGLSAFRGVGRRLERLGEAAGVLFLDDYGHHPTEIKATLEAVRAMHPRRRLVVVFQPHRYSRTKLLWREFGGSFVRADLVAVMDVYPAGEKPIRGVDSGLILRSLRRRRVPCLPFTRAVDFIRELKRGDIVLTLGAGDVWKAGEDVRRRLREETLSPA